MFANLLYLILAFLALDLAPSSPFTPPPYFYGGVALSYGMLLLFQLFQKKYLSSSLRELFTQVLPLLYLVGLYYGFFFKGMAPPLLSIPLGLILYLGALGIGQSWKRVLFLLPFSIPFVLYLLAKEFLAPLLPERIFFISILSLFLLTLILFPLLLTSLWKCRPLPSCPLKTRLHNRCTYLKFRHGGLLQGSLGGATAAIIGIFFPFRYILFTDKLLLHFSEEEIEAILIHEVGHCAYKHLFFYPLLFVGIPLLGEGLIQWIRPSSPFLLFGSYALFIFFYIRYFLGFISRQFERQADLYIFKTDHPAHFLSQAFSRLSTLNSLPLNKKNWHHGSLSERIACLQRAEQNPALIERHSLKVDVSLAIYIVVLLTAGFYFL